MEGNRTPQYSKNLTNATPFSCWKTQSTASAHAYHTHDSAERARGVDMHTFRFELARKYPQTAS